VPDELVNVRYMVDDVEKAVDFYTTVFGFTVRTDFAPAFADVVRGNLRLLLSGPKSSAGRPMPDGRTPEPGGWNRIHFIVDDIDAEVERLRAADVNFRNEVISGPGGRQILLEDPAGNPIEVFEPA
jgi:catechol 2,3-dioxygenase-like lactoylglutathione lyase family enzyme